MQQQTTTIANNDSQPPILTVTPSNVLYLSCLRKYDELAIHKRYSGLRQQSPALRFSSGLHWALRQIYDSKNGPIPNLDNLQGYIRAAYLREAYQSSADREHDVCRAAKIIADYVESDVESGDAACTIAVERTGIYQVQAVGISYLLHSRLDRALVRPSTPDVLTVRDYKVGRLSLEGSQVAINLAVAKCIWPNYRSYTLEVEGLVDGGEPERITYHSSECKGVIKMITQQVRRYACASTYEAEMGEACIYCQARQGCPAHSGNAVDADALDFEE